MPSPQLPPAPTQRHKQQRWPRRAPPVPAQALAAKLQPQQLRQPKHARQLLHQLKQMPMPHHRRRVPPSRHLDPARQPQPKRAPQQPHTRPRQPRHWLTRKRSRSPSLKLKHSPLPHPRRPRVPPVMRVRRPRRRPPQRPRLCRRSERKFCCLGAGCRRRESRRLRASYRGRGGRDRCRGVGRDTHPHGGRRGSLRCCGDQCERIGSSRCVSRSDGQCLGQRRGRRGSERFRSGECRSLCLGRGQQFGQCRRCRIQFVLGFLQRGLLCQS